MNLAKRMLRYRAKHNLTQRQLADLCKINRCYLSEIENGADPGKIVREKIELVIGGEDNG